MSFSDRFSDRGGVINRTTMAIGKYSAVPPPAASPGPVHGQHGAPPAPAPIPQHAHSASGTIDIEAWTISALESLSVSPDSRGTGGTPLAIPLDDHGHRRVTIADHEGGAGVAPPRRPPSRRDSMRRRELLLKGKEGSRQRRRWDMGEPAPPPHHPVARRRGHN